ncbi:MAG: 30S ribosomal protein S5 [Patescibacteria group bacterium]|nr:30S ribosomal protein S5 [Patescibacteria group bacterium]
MKKRFKKHRDKNFKKREYEQNVIEIARISRVVAGGRRMRFRACMVIGDMKGKIGLGVKKGADVATAINKAVNAAKKEMIKVKTIDETIPHEMRVKYKSAKVLIKPAPKGTGIIAGGAVRAALELTGIKNIVAKMIGSKNKINNVKALIKALKELKEPRKEKNTKKKEKESKKESPEKNDKDRIKK